MRVSDADCGRCSRELFFLTYSVMPPSPCSPWSGTELPLGPLFAPPPRVLLLFPLRKLLEKMSAGSSCCFGPAVLLFVAAPAAAVPRPALVAPLTLEPVFPPLPPPYEGFAKLDVGRDCVPAPEAAPTFAFATGMPAVWNAWCCAASCTAFWYSLTPLVPMPRPAGPLRVAVGRFGPGDAPAPNPAVPPRRRPVPEGPGPCAAARPEVAGPWSPSSLSLATPGSFLPFRSITLLKFRSAPNPPSELERASRRPVRVVAPAGWYPLFLSLVADV
mmetsp:Transcript_53/g.98  ORF Transcript_53/g.98 Transcript_53/m.98 type:complete len:273 (+) Transcript_53:465-1283(+)